jgi:hypothetical protein
MSEVGGKISNGARTADLKLTFWVIRRDWRYLWLRKREKQMPIKIRAVRWDGRNVEGFK